MCALIGMIIVAACQACHAEGDTPGLALESGSVASHSQESLPLVLTPSVAVAELIERIAGGDVRVQAIFPERACGPDEMAARMKALTAADLVLYDRFEWTLSLEFWLERLASQNRELTIRCVPCRRSVAQAAGLTSTQMHDWQANAASIEQLAEEVARLAPHRREHIEQSARTILAEMARPLATGSRSDGTFNTGNGR